MKKLLEKYQKATMDEVMQEIAKVAISRELTKEELALAYTLVEYKSTGGAANATSLLSLKGKKSTANPTSLVNASVSEEDLTSIVKLVNEDTVAEKAIAEKARVDADKDAEIARLKKENTENAAKLQVFEAEKAAKEKADRDAKIKTRKDELGEFAKDMKDEDILDEMKYENAKLKKENADLRAGKKIEVPAVKPDFTKGSLDKKPDEALFKTQKAIDEYAFGKNATKTE